MVSVIIVNYNTRQLTMNCLESVFEKTKEVALEVILVDNNSTECDPVLFKNAFPQIKLIRSSSNLGFAGGNNLGIAAASGELILLLNSDTELVNDAISIAANLINKNSSIGALSGKLLYPDGKVQPVAGRFPSIWREAMEFLRWTKWMSASSRARHMHGDLLDYSERVETDWIWGTFFMIRRTVLNQFPDKKLQDHYFMYYEDVVWCHFIRTKLHLSVVFDPAPLIIHHLSGSSINKDRDQLFKERILPNETDFLLKEKGRVYTFFYYFIKAIHLLSLRKPMHRSQAFYYLNHIKKAILK